MEINVNVSLLWLLYYTAVGGRGVKGDGWTVDHDCRLQGSAGCWMHGSCFMLVCEGKIISCLKSCGSEQTGSPGVGQNLKGSGSHPAAQSVQCLFCPQHANRVDVLKLWQLVQCSKLLSVILLLENSRIQTLHEMRLCQHKKYTYSKLNEVFGK